MENTPQLEDGYTRIANELVEAMARGCPGFTEGQIIFCILRKTYGWNKKSDKISISQLVEMTGKSRRMIIYALQNLEAKKMITIVRSFQHINEISLNKNYSEWQPEAKSSQYQKLHLVQHIAPSAKFSTNLVQHSVNNIPKVAPTKETTTKEIISKDIKEVRTSYVLPFKRSYGNADINTLLDTISKLTPTGKLDGSEKDNRRMANSIIKKYTLETALKALRNVKGSFYEGKINSARNLYNNFNALLNVKVDTRTTDLSDLISNSYKKL